MVKENRKKKIVVAMSGGIDSSVAAAMLKKEGYDVVGVFMKFWIEPQRGSTLIYTNKNTNLHKYENKCCTLEAERRARKVAKILKIPFYVFNFEKEFKKRIVDYFLDGYKKGMTPNPCVICNKEIKFGLLLEKALALDADFIATGHYAKIRKFVNSPRSRAKLATGQPRSELRSTSGAQQIRYSLIAAKDKEKDQSYFLWQLNQGQLKRILFPVGDYTKSEVRKLALKFKLPVLNIPESMEICFIPTTVNDFLKRYLKQPNPGKIICLRSGLKQGRKVISRHRGLPFYTIGQRKGIGLSGGPFYVVDKNQKKNLLIISKNEKDLSKKELIAKNINWISGGEPKFPLKIKAKIRYRHEPAQATVTYNLKLKTYNLKFDKPQRAITPGQSVVFYRDEELVGGGIIC